MDKAREMRRAATRFSSAKRQIKRSGHKLVSVLNGGGNVDSSKRSKREKVRGSSQIGRESPSNEDSEMDGGSEGEEGAELRPRSPLPPPSPTTGSSKRPKLPKKPFDECNAADPAAVPRKLRSAMNKRNRGSILPPLPDAKKLHYTSNGFETPQTNCAKKSKQEMKQVGSSDGSPSHASSGPITKDEEEVVETLYALAKMLPNNPVKSTVAEKTSEAKSSPLPKTWESSVPASEAPNEESMKSPLTSNIAEVKKVPSNLEGSPGENLVINILTEENTVCERPSIPETQKFDLDSHSLVTQAGLQRVSLLFKQEHTDETPLCNATSLSDPSELFPETGRLMHPKQQRTDLPERKPDDILWQAAAVAMKQEQQHPLKAKKESRAHVACTEGGPRLYTAGSCSSGVHGPWARSASTRAPAWLETATCSIRHGAVGNGVSTEKVSPIVVDRRQCWKRCATHFYISRLIQAYQTAEKMRRWPVPLNQLTENEGGKSGIVEVSNLTGMRAGLNGITSANNLGGCPTEKNLIEARLDIPLDKRLQQDQKQAATTSGIYFSLSQSCNFLSLSSGRGTIEASDSNSNNDNNSNPAGNGLEPSKQVQVPYLNSLVQHHPLMPFSIPHTHYSSTPYPDQLTAATAAQQVQLQLPHYLGSPFYGLPHLGQAGPAKQQQHHHHQLTQLWAAHLDSPGRIPVSHFPKWQSRRQEFTSLIPCAQAILPTSPPPLEGLDGKFFPSPQQQQPLFAVSSSSSYRGKQQQQQQQQHLQSSYDQGVGGFHSEGSSHLPLLCNAEHL